MVHRVLLSFIHAHLNPEGRTPLAAITDEALAAGDGYLPDLGLRPFTAFCGLVAGPSRVRLRRMSAVERERSTQETRKSAEFDNFTAN
jgi:hypothetical protein